MPMTRQERNALHQNQKRIRLDQGEPNVREVAEGTSVLRNVLGGGMVEYFKFEGVLHKNGTTGDDFEINDISIVYRLKGIK